MESSHTWGACVAITGSLCHLAAPIVLIVMNGTIHAQVAATGNRVAVPNCVNRVGNDVTIGTKSEAVGKNGSGVVALSLPGMSQPHGSAMTSDNVS